MRESELEAVETGRAGTGHIMGSLSAENPNLYRRERSFLQFPATIQKAHGKTSKVSQKGDLPPNASPQVEKNRGSKKSDSEE